MKFTDDDLKQLKEELNSEVSIESREHFYEECNCCEVAGMVKALLARLEAAEACIDEHRGDCLADVGRKCSCGYSDKLKAWRTAAGK